MKPTTFKEFLREYEKLLYHSPRGRGLHYKADRALLNALRLFESELKESLFANPNGFMNSFTAKSVLSSAYADMLIWHLLDSAVLFWELFDTTFYTKKQ